MDPQASAQNLRYDFTPQIQSFFEVAEDDSKPILERIKAVDNLLQLLDCDPENTIYPRLSSLNDRLAASNVSSLLSSYVDDAITIIPSFKGKTENVTFLAGVLNGVGAPCYKEFALKFLEQLPAHYLNSDARIAMETYYHECQKESDALSSAFFTLVSEVTTEARELKRLNESPWQRLRNMIKKLS